MKQVNKLLTTKLSTSQTQAGQTDYSENDLYLINMVFGRLKSIFGSKYKITFPTEKAVTASKREWSGDIITFNIEELERGFRALKSSDIDWPDIKSFLSLCKAENKEPCHQLFALPPPCNINREEGKKRSAQLMKMMTQRKD